MTRAHFATVAVAILSALAVSGLAAARPSMGQTNLRKAVLQTSDLSPGFTVKQTGFVSVPRAQSAYVTVFLNPNGSLVDLARVDSEAALYASRAGAKAAISRLVTQIHGSHGYRVSELKIGRRLGTDRAYLLRARYYRNGVHMEVKTIAWQEGRMQGVIDALGLSGTIVPTHVVALARKQDRRLLQA